MAAGSSGRGAVLSYLPPDSRDLNPIELVFSKMKDYLRKAAERTVDDLWRRIGIILDDLRSRTASFSSRLAKEKGLPSRERSDQYCEIGKTFNWPWLEHLVRTRTTWSPDVKVASAYDGFDLSCPGRPP